MGSRGTTEGQSTGALKSQRHGMMGDRTQSQPMRTEGRAATDKTLQRQCAWLRATERKTGGRYPAPVQRKGGRQQA